MFTHYYTVAQDPQWDSKDSRERSKKPQKVNGFCKRYEILFNFSIKIVAFLKSNFIAIKESTYGCIRKKHLNGGFAAYFKDRVLREKATRD